MARVTITKTTFNSGGAPGIDAPWLNTLQDNLIAVESARLDKDGAIAWTKGQPQKSSANGNAQLGFGLHGQGDAGVDAQGDAAVLGGNLVWLKHNNYFDGQDKFIDGALGTATQMHLTSGGLEMRFSTNTPATGAAVTWGPWLPLMPIFSGTTDPTTLYSNLPDGIGWVNR